MAVNSIFSMCRVYSVRIKIAENNYIANSEK